MLTGSVSGNGLEGLLPYDFDPANLLARDLRAVSSREISVQSKTYHDASFCHIFFDYLDLGVPIGLLLS